MKKILFILIVLLSLLIHFSNNLCSSDFFVLEEALNPDKIAVYENRLYVVDNTKILVYSLEDFKLEDQFGRKGEGPGEFITNPSFDMKLDINIFPGGIYLSSAMKYARFDLQGSYLSEQRFPFYAAGFQPLNEGFVVLKFSPTKG